MSMARKGHYGIDAPYVPLFMALGLVACLLLHVFAHIHALWLTIAILALLLACYLHTTLRGKFVVWAELLDGLQLRGDERVLDLGCGRGAILLMAAQRLPRGHAIGIDIWSTSDQSGNAMATTQANAVAEGVAGRIELRTADMRDLPFADDSFDAIVSNVAIHNIAGAAGREQAVDEALRVLRPGGRLLVADIKHARRYEARLRALGAIDVARRGLGWRMWWGNPFVPTTLVSARKPAS
jgi:SAM-dependent methyltransferase